MFQTTEDDVLFHGHGATILGRGNETRVPKGVDFYTFGPPGTSMTGNLSDMLVGGQLIRQIYLSSPKSKDTVNIEPTVYTYESGPIPGLILDGSEQTRLGQKGIVPHIIGVNDLTNLHDMWPLLDPFKKPGQRLRVIWTACSTIGDAYIDPRANGR